MPKFLSFLFLFIFSVYAAAQNTYTIKGKVVSNADLLPLESATVYFTTVKDSTVLEYTLTDKNGNFVFQAKKNENPVFLKVTFVGFQTYADEQKDISADKDFKTIPLLESVNELEGVTIKADDAPIRIKNDTIEFKASLFKVRPDANVETLLKTLPGFEVDSDGKITVNGKEVTQVLVNGKPFFARDGKMAVKNLPAEIINKVQVSDFKTKKEEYSKVKASADNSSINLTVDENKNKGYFGKFLGGYGTAERYESSFIVNFFNNERKISLLGSSNNINAPGFSMDEVFDNMRGGRNSSRDTDSRRTGITKSNLLGVNYSDQLFKDFQVNGNYNYSDAHTENNHNSNSTELRPDGIFYETKSNSKTDNIITSNKANIELEYKIGSDIRIAVAPSFSNSVSESNPDSNSISDNVTTGKRAFDDYSKSSNRNETNNFNNSFNFNKSFEKKARNLSVVFNNDNSNLNSNNFTESETNFYTTDKTIIRDQNVKNYSKRDNYAAEIEYTEPVTDSLRFKIAINYYFENNINDDNTYDNTGTRENKIFTDLNENQTTYMTSKINGIFPAAGISFEKNKFTFDIYSRMYFVKYQNHAFYKSAPADVNKNYVWPEGNAQIRYRIDRSKFFTLQYDYEPDLPKASQLLPIENVSNPLNTVTGNPDLNVTEKHSASIFYRNFDFSTRSGYDLYLRGNYNSNDIISTTVYTSDNSGISSYQNISGNYSVSGGGNWNKSIKNEDNLLRFGISLNANYSFNKGYTDRVLYGAKSTEFLPRIYLNYDYGDFFTIAPSYNFSYNETKYDISTLKSRLNVVHSFNLKTTSYWSKNWIWGNDFGYTYNSNLSSGLSKDFYLWNTSLSYTFYEDKFTAKIKVYDVLNQNQSISRDISSKAVTDNSDTVLKRYAMFSLIYKIKDFSRMKNPPK